MIKRAIRSVGLDPGLAVGAVLRVGPAVGWHTLRVFTYVAIVGVAASIVGILHIARRADIVK